MINKKDIKVGVRLRSKISLSDLVRDRIYIVTRIFNDIFEYREIGEQHRERNEAPFDEADMFFVLAERTPITNWKERIK